MAFEMTSMLAIQLLGYFSCIIQSIRIPEGREYKERLQTSDEPY